MPTPTRRFIILLILNTPTLNLLGTSEPETYGPAALAVFKKGLQDIFPTVDFRFE